MRSSCSGGYERFLGKLTGCKEPRKYKVTSTAPREAGNNAFGPSAPAGRVRASRPYRNTGERGRIRTFDPCLKRVAKSTTNNNLHVPAYFMQDTTKSMRCQQDFGLRTRRVPRNQASRTVSLRFCWILCKTKSASFASWITLSTLNVRTAGRHELRLDSDRVSGLLARTWHQCSAGRAGSSRVPQQWIEDRLERGGTASAELWSRVLRRTTCRSRIDDVGRRRRLHSCRHSTEQYRDDAASRPGTSVSPAEGVA
jgi:hypothetical protein